MPRGILRKSGDRTEKKGLSSHSLRGNWAAQVKSMPGKKLNVVYTMHTITIVTEKQGNSSGIPSGSEKSCSGAGVEEERRPIKRLAVITVRMDKREFGFAQRGGRIFSGAEAFV